MSDMYGAIRSNTFRVKDAAGAAVAIFKTYDEAYAYAERLQTIGEQL